MNLIKKYENIKLITGIEIQEKRILAFLCKMFIL